MAKVERYVELNSPYGHMSVRAGGATIQNGTRGKYLGAARDGRLQIQFEGHNNTVTFVPVHWVTFEGEQKELL